MIPRRDWAVIGGAILIFLGPFLMVSLALWLNSTQTEVAVQELLKIADDLASDVTSEQLLAGIFLVLVIGALIGGFSLWVLLWMTGVVLLLILRELREIKALQS